MEIHYNYNIKKDSWFGSDIIGRSWVALKRADSKMEVTKGLSDGAWRSWHPDIDGAW